MHIIILTEIFQSGDHIVGEIESTKVLKKFQILNFCDEILMQESENVQNSSTRFIATILFLLHLQASQLSHVTKAFYLENAIALQPNAL